MYAWMRDIHLGLGLFFALGLLVFGVSSVEMAHHFAFKWLIKDKWGQQTLEVPAELRDNPRGLAALAREHGVRGDLVDVKTSSLALQLKLRNPGTIHTLTLDRDASVAKVASKSRGVLWTMNRLHHTAGLWHDDARINGWGWFVLMCSFGMLLLGGTGMVMWWMRAKERRLGLILLVPTVLVMSGLTAWIRLSG